MVPIDQRIGTMGSAGRLMPGITARVLKPDGTQATYGEPGELFVSGPSLALRYANNEEACVKLDSSFVFVLTPVLVLRKLF